MTLAKHPSENDLRLMVHLAAFVLNADENLALSKGISQDDEPDLWKKALDGEIKLRIDLGQPDDEKHIRKAWGRSKQVIIYTCQEGSALGWRKQAEKTLKRFKNLRVINLKVEGKIEILAQRTMSFQCNISNAELSLLNNDEIV